MNEIFSVAFVDSSMQNFHEEKEPIEMQHAQNRTQKDHDAADMFVGGKMWRKRVIQKSCIGEPLHHDKPSPKPAQNQ